MTLHPKRPYIRGPYKRARLYIYFADRGEGVKNVTNRWTSYMDATKHISLSPHVTLSPFVESFRSNGKRIRNSVSCLSVNAGSKTVKVWNWIGAFGDWLQNLELREKLIFNWILENLSVKLALTILPNETGRRHSIIWNYNLGWLIFPKTWVV